MQTLRIANSREIPGDQAVKLLPRGALLPAGPFAPQHGDPVTGVAYCRPVGEAAWSCPVGMPDSTGKQRSPAMSEPEPEVEIL